MAMKLNDFTSLTLPQTVLITVIFLLTTPAMGAILLYYPETLEKLDILKIVFISIVFGMMLIVPSVVGFGVAPAQRKQKDDELEVYFKVHFTLCGAIIALLSGLLALIAYIFGIDFKVYVIAEAFISIGTGILIYKTST